MLRKPTESLRCSSEFQVALLYLLSCVVDSYHTSFGSDTNAVGIQFRQLFTLSHEFVPAGCQRRSKWHNVQVIRAAIKVCRPEKRSEVKYLALSITLIATSQLVGLLRFGSTFCYLAFSRVYKLLHFNPGLSGPLGIPSSRTIRQPEEARPQ